MDRSLTSLESAPRFSWPRLWVVVLASVSIIGIGSFLVRTFPNSGYSAGYDAAIAKGSEWIHARVEAANGTVLPVCNELHRQSVNSALDPTYDYDTFIEGCRDGVGDLYGHRLPAG